MGIYFLIGDRIKSRLLDGVVEQSGAKAHASAVALQDVEIHTLL